MIESITFITGNPAKVAWLERHIGIPINHQRTDVSEIQSLDLEEVVRAKAEEAYRELGKPLLVEDTSLVFQALGKLPGPFIKWFLEELTVEGLCRLLDGKDRSAIAQVMYGLHTGKEIVVFDARMHGRIADNPRGENGFGWDKAFIPQGAVKTWGEMTDQEQNNTSMRKIAIEKLNRYLLK